MLTREQVEALARQRAEEALATILAAGLEPNETLMTEMAKRQAPLDAQAALDADREAQVQVQPEPAKSWFGNLFGK